MKLFHRPIFRITVALAASAFAVCAAWAQAPSRVARLSDFAGEIQLANDREDWHPISRNFPITAGDNLFVGLGGRAELDVGSIQTWIAGGSNVYFDQFDDQLISARLTDGTIAVRIRSLDGDAVRVTTAYGEVAFTQPGFYIVSSNTPGSYESQFAQPSLKVRRGEAQFFAPTRAPLAVRQGQVLMLDRNELRESRYYRVQSLESFEAWATSRDGRIGRFDQRYAGVINPLMIGARDLAEHGSWADSYEYGQVWYPTSVAADWAPYRFGRWSWVQPWGWTWVDDAAWGFAPFHYGRWVRVGNRWAWSPGQNVARPIYAPALVTFFGGDQWSYGNSGPTFSWVPLGWNEPYAPWYTYTPTYWREVNRPYVRGYHSDNEPWRPQHFVHTSIPGAITAVASTAFLAGRPVAQNYMRNVNERDLRSAPPARMGEVLPHSSRFASPSQPLVVPRAGEPNRFPASAIMRDRGRADAPHVMPNTNVMQPRVIQDPNPVVGRRTEPDNRNSRITEPAIPMSKERDGRSMAPGVEPRQVQPMQAPQPGYRGVAPQLQQAPQAPQVPQFAPQPAPVRTAPPALPPAQVIAPQPAPVARAPSAPPRRGMENRPAVVTEPTPIAPVAPVAPRSVQVAPQPQHIPTPRVAPQPMSVPPAAVVAPTRPVAPPAPVVAPVPTVSAPAKPTPAQPPQHDKGRAPALPAQPVTQQQ